MHNITKKLMFATHNINLCYILIFNFGTMSKNLLCPSLKFIVHYQHVSSRLNIAAKCVLKEIQPWRISFEYGLLALAVLQR